VLTLTVHNLAGTVVLRCQGRIVRGEESPLLCAAVQHYGRNIVLDLGGVSAIDAAGIGALVSLQAAGLYLRLLNPTDSVRSVLRLTGLESILEIHERQVVEEILGPVEILPESSSLSPEQARVP
jgi:anti-anti-sigma factor